MNSINRFEETWTPQWDLGLQAEFGFGGVEETLDEELPTLTTERPNAWAMASREVLNRQNPVERRIACDTSSVADLVSFFETLSLEISK